MSQEDFIAKALGTELNSIENILAPYVGFNNEKPKELTDSDLDRELALEEDNKNAALIIGESDDTYNDIVSYMASREIEDRTRRDINIAKATRKQLMLSSIRIMHDRYAKLHAIMKEREQANK